MKVNGFNDVFRSGATSATECQAAKQIDALIKNTLSCFTSLFFSISSCFSSSWRQNITQQTPEGI